MNAKAENQDFPINHELLSQAAKVLEEWKTIRDRIKKIEEHKEQVSLPVYKRVLEDYKDRIDSITEKVLDKKGAIDRELVTLYETQKKVKSQLESHQHSLEEIKFRNLLGEYTEPEYQRHAKEIQEKISKFESIVSSINTNIARYEDLFKDEENLFAANKELEESITKVEQEQQAAAKNKSEQEDDGSYSEENFFGKDEDEDYFSTNEQTNPQDQPEIFNSANTDRVRSPKAKSRKESRIVIISGDDAGATYPLKDVITFGRAESSTVVLRDAKVSRQHAKILQKGGEYILADLNSSNGTYVNGEKIDEHVLANNDELQIGDTVLQFQM